MALDIPEAAQMLGVSPETVRRWARMGMLPGRGSGADWSVEAADLERWARNQGIGVQRAPAAAVMAAAPAADAPARRPLLEALQRGRILREVGGGTPEEVLAALAPRCPLPPETSAAQLLEQLLQRERMFSTAIGHGIALPHPRTQSAALGRTPTLVVGFLAQKVAWKAIDQQPVDTVFLALCPTPEQHLQLLSRVMYLLRLPAFVELLASRAGDAELLRLVEQREPAPGPVQAAGRASQ